MSEYLLPAVTAVVMQRESVLTALGDGRPVMLVGHGGLTQGRRVKRHPALIEMLVPPGDGTLLGPGSLEIQGLEPAQKRPGRGRAVLRLHAQTVGDDLVHHRWDLQLLVEQRSGRSVGQQVLDQRAVVADEQVLAGEQEVGDAAAGLC